jgi:tRNA pseudouridine32 synthase/23S rRNA pseudouridine746 synthase
MTADQQAPHLASSLHLPPGNWATVLDCLCDHFDAIDREQWTQRMRDGRVLDARRRALEPGHPYRCGMQVFYFREVPDEKPIPFEVRIVHADPDLVVADKPHFLPVMPSGSYLEHTLQRRLMRALDNPHLVPLHRIDRATAGLVLLSANPATRAAYQSLFLTRAIEKRYEAIAAPLASCNFPLQRHSRLERGDPFFLQREVEGVANSHSLIDVLQRGPTHWRYLLTPVTGKQHQLRVHMAALGAPIWNDAFYPSLESNAGHDYSRPLQLLARSLSFADPVNGRQRRFESGFRLLDVSTPLARE